MKFEWDVKYIEECIVGFFAILLAVKPIRVWVVTYIKNFLKSRKDKKNIPIILTQIHEKVSDIDIRLKDVEYEIKDPNSGGTLKGALKLIKAEIDATLVDPGLDSSSFLAAQALREASHSIGVVAP